MKKTLATIAATTGLAIAGFAGVASAQSYGDAEPASTTEVEDTSGIATVQVDGDEPTDTEDGDAADTAQEAESRDHGRGRGGCNVDAAAEAIGIDADELRAALDDGQTIAEVADEAGVDPADVVDAMVEAKAEHLAEKVEAGRLTQDEADERLVEETSEIEARVAGDEDAGS